jgi:hypothetical protein
MVTAKERANSTTQINKQVNTLTNTKSALRLQENTAERALNTNTLTNNVLKQNNSFEKVLSNTKEVPKMASGGIVPQGYSNDSYPALLTSGEMVVPPTKIPEFERRKEKVHVVIEGKVKGQDIYYITQEVKRKYQNSH